MKDVLTWFAFGGAVLASPAGDVENANFVSGNRLARHALIDSTSLTGPANATVPRRSVANTLAELPSAVGSEWRKRNVHALPQGRFDGLTADGVKAKYNDPNVQNRYSDRTLLGEDFMLDDANVTCTSTYKMTVN